LAWPARGGWRGLRYITGLDPPFPTEAHPVFIGPRGLLGCVVPGILAGALSAVLTLAVYGTQEVFQHLKIHWMWWPAIGGLVGKRKRLLRDLRSSSPDPIESLPFARRAAGSKTLVIVSRF
jgi:hypothetical protein